MRLLLFLSALSLAFLSAQGQLPADSLRLVLKTKPVNRASFEEFTALIPSLNPSDTAAWQLIYQWVDEHTTADSLADIRAQLYLQMGRAYTIASRYGEATRYLTEAQAIAEKKNFGPVLAQTLNVLGTIYKSNGQVQKAADYFQRSSLISKKNNYLPGESKALYNRGALIFENSNGDPHRQKEGIQNMVQAFRIANHLKDTQSIINQSNGLAGLYTALKKYDSALFYLNIAEHLLSVYGKETQLVNHYATVARNYMAKKDYQKALSTFSSGLTLVEKYNAPRWMCMYYSGLAETYENLGDYRKANHYNQLNIKMHDAMVSKENFIAAADIQNKYERVRKDNEILQLAAVNKQKSTLNKILLGSLAALLMIGSLGYMNFRKSRQLTLQEQAMQKQKISELEKDRQLLAIDAMLRGQETERSRIAKELHDGLGGLLSGVKLSFMNLKDEISLKEIQHTKFEKSLSLLDNTIADLRKVAHNLMPEILVKFGLTEAIRDFCHTLQSSTGIPVLYQQFGAERKLPETAEVFTYRIIQELVNNSVKHASASRIIVQLIYHDHSIGLTVEDNGKGFDSKLLETSKGAGMRNIDYRVQYCNGNCEIHTAPGSGTSVEILLRV